MASLPYPRSPLNSFHRTTLSLFAQVLPRNSQKFQAEDILPRISQNTQKLLAEKSLPQISQMRTDG